MMSLDNRKEKSLIQWRENLTPPPFGKIGPNESII